MKKKRLILKLGMIVAMLLSFITVSAYDFEVDGIRYNVKSHTDYTVETTISPDVTVGDNGLLSIPEMVRYGAKDLKVIKIGDRSFMSNTDIKDVILPTNAESIGEYAFSNCTSLKSLKATNIQAVLAHAFEGCVELANLSFGEGISEVKEYSFSSCSSLRDFNYCQNIRTIGAYAFSNSGLESFILNEHGLTIGNYAFAESKNLRSVDFQKNTSSLAIGMFKGCESLINLINFSVPTEIPSFCFQNCTDLNITSILDSSTLETISSYSLAGCLYPEALILKANIRSIGDCAIMGFNGDLEIEDSYNTLNITEQSFSGMNIVKLRLGRNLSIWKFKFPSSMQSLIIGPFVSEIAPKVEVNPGNSYYSGYTYGGAPFVECKNLESIELESTSEPLFISGVGKQLDYSHSGGDYKDWYYTYSFSGVFSECPIKNLKILRPITFDNSARYTFKRSNKYYDYTTYNWQNPFHGVSTVNSLKVDHNAFVVAPITPSLKKLSIDFYVNDIPDLSICDIESIDLKTPFPPNAVGFSSKTYMNCCLNIPPEQQSEYEAGQIWSNFWNIIETPSLLCCIKDSGLLYHIVEENQLSLIKDKTLYKGEISLPEEVVSDGKTYIVSGIEKNAFNNCNGLIALNIPGTVTRFGESAFSGCVSLRSLHFEDSENILSFPIGDFDHTSSIISKTINGQTVRFAISYYYGYFSGLPITELYIGRNICDDSRYSIVHDGYKYNITSYDAPFNNLPKLTDLCIGENVSVLGPDEEYISEVEMYSTPGSFKKSSNIKTVNVKSTNPPTGAEFASAVYSNAQLIVPDNAISLYQSAEGWKDFANIIDESLAGIEIVSSDNAQTPFTIDNGDFTWVGDGGVVSIYTVDGRLQMYHYVQTGERLQLEAGLYIVKSTIGTFKVRL